MTGPPMGVHVAGSAADLERVTISTRQRAPHSRPARAPGGAPGRTVGAKSVLRALDHLDPAARPVVLVALDAPAALVDAVRQRAADLSLTVIDVASATALGARVGVDRPVATVLELG